jgi:hypothetical protein
MRQVGPERTTFREQQPEFGGLAYEFPVYSTTWNVFFPSLEGANCDGNGQD